MSKDYEHPDSKERRLARALWQGLSIEDELAYARAIKRHGIPSNETDLAEIELEANLATFTRDEGFSRYAVALQKARDYFTAFPEETIPVTFTDGEGHTFSIARAEALGGE